MFHIFNFQERKGGTLPKQVTNLVERVFLFKVETKLTYGKNFESSYKVKKISEDPNLINKFHEHAAIPVYNHLIIMFIIRYIVHYLIITPNFQELSTPIDSSSELKSHSSFVIEINKMDGNV